MLVKQAARALSDAPKAAPSIRVHWFLGTRTPPDLWARKLENDEHHASGLFLRLLAEKRDARATGDRARAGRAAGASLGTVFHVNDSDAPPHGHEEEFALAFSCWGKARMRVGPVESIAAELYERALPSPSSSSSSSSSSFSSGDGGGMGLVERCSTSEQGFLHGLRDWQEIDLTQNQYAFVCVHGTRDARCEKCGNRVLLALRQKRKDLEPKSQAGEKRLHLYGCSHVGGHKFAGNVISYPDGRWFSLVSGENAPSLYGEILHPSANPSSQATSSPGWVYRGASWERTMQN